MNGSMACTTSYREGGYGGERMDQWLVLLVTERGAMAVNEWINGLHY